MLEETGLDPALLTLEITEGVLVTESEATAQTLVDLKALGLRLVLDDFGTGYSSLAYLRRFPIDGLKIDRRFIASMDQSAEDPTDGREDVAAVLDSNLPRADAGPPVLAGVPSLER